MDDKLFELVEKMYLDMNRRFDTMEKEIKTIGSQVLKLENELKPKTEALFDGYKQHTEILDRIEKEVSKQEEIIMRRVK